MNSVFGKDMCDTVDRENGIGNHDVRGIHRTILVLSKLIESSIRDFVELVVNKVLLSAT